MSDETVLLGPEVVASNVWLHVGAAGSILDEPCYVDGVVQSVTLWLRRDQASSGTCFLDVFDRHGDHFTLVRSARLSVDFARTTSSQTLSLAPTPVARGQYVGLRAVDGHLWLNYLDGPGAHLWWNVDPATGTAAKYISGESVGFNVTVVGRSGEGREWHGVNHPDTGRVLRWRSEEKPGLYSFLPSEFVLTLRPDSALPGFEPFLYLRQAASALTQLTDYRVRLRLRAAPRLRRAEREFLRGEIKRATGRPAVRLQAAFDLAARLSVAVGPAASVSGPQAEPAVDIREGFTLEYDLPAAEYGLVREQLTASGGGIIGSVHVPLGPGVEAAIPVRLTLRDVYIGGVTAGPPAGPLSKPSPNAVQIQIENQMPVPAIVGGLSILIAAGESEPPRVASPPGIQAVHWPLVVSASNHAMVTVRRPSEATKLPALWRLWEVFVDDVTTPQATVDSWIDAIDRSPESGQALLPISVFVSNLSRRRADWSDFIGVRVTVKGAIPVDGLVRVDGSDTWNAQLGRSLTDIVGGGPMVSFDYEVRNVYSDGEGAAQRVRNEGQSAVWQALSVERAGCRYALLDAETNAIIADDLERAAVDQATEWLRARGRRWRLAVSPPRDSAAPTTLDVLGGLLELAPPVQRVVVTLKTATAGPQVFSFTGPTAAPIRFATGGASLPFEWEVVQHLDGDKVHSERGTESTHPFLWLFAPGAP